MKTIIFKYFTYVAAVCAIALLAMSCSDDKDVYKDRIIDTYLTLSDDSYTFRQDGGDAFTVKIESSSAFSVGEPSESWVSVTTSDLASEIIIMASENDDTTKRTASIEISNTDGLTRTISLGQLGVASEIIYPATGYIYLNHSATTVLSPKGKYLSYVSYVDNGDTTDYSLWLHDVETGVATIIATITENIIPVAVSDNGEVLCSATVDGYHFDADGNMSTLELPAGFSTSGTRKAYTISSDGSIWGGYGQLSGLKTGIVWNNGVPTQVDSGTVNYWGDTGSIEIEIYGGASVDGTVHAAGESGTRGPCVINNGSMNYVAQDAINKHQLSLEITYEGVAIGTNYEDVADYPMVGVGTHTLSGNGQYMALQYYQIEQIMFTISYEDFISGAVDLSSVIKERVYPMVGNTQTGEYKILNDDDTYLDYSGATTNNDGVLIFTYKVSSTNVTPPNGMYNSYAYDPQTDTVVPAHEWIRDNYGLIVPEDIIVTRISDDDRTILGYRYVNLGTPTYRYWYLHVE